MMRKMTGLFLALILCTVFFHNIFFQGYSRGTAAEQVRADPPVLPGMQIVDINEGPAGSEPDSFTSGDDNVFFTGWAEDWGREVWWISQRPVTETVTAHPATDLNPLYYSSDPTDLTWYDNSLYFIAQYKYRSLWRTDGSGPGSVQPLNDYNGDPMMETAYYPTVHDQHLFFSYYSAGLGQELWRTDGTPAGTIPLSDIYPGTSGSYPTQLTSCGDFLYFSAYDTAGQNLWQTQGPAGTAKPAAMPNGSFGSYPNQLTVVGDTLFFTGTWQGKGAEILYVPGNGGEPFGGHDINPGPAGCSPQSLSSDGKGNLYFVADGGEDTGWQGFMADTSSAKPFTDLPKQSERNPFDAFGAANGHVFWKIHGSGSIECWNGEPQSSFKYILDLPYVPFPIKTPVFYPIPLGMVISGLETVLPGIKAESDDRSTTETWVSLWFSDGTVEGTRLLKRFVKVDETRAVSLPRNFSWINGLLYFCADDGIHGPEVWISDLTPEGTILAVDLQPGQKGSDPSNSNLSGSALFFAADDGSWAGRELHVLDSANGLPRMVADVAGYNSGNVPENLMVNQDLLFFTHDDDIHGRELWRSDGSTTGTFMTADIRPGFMTSSPIPLGFFKDLLFFRASDGETGSELWSTDGHNPPSLFWDIAPGMSSSTPSNFAATDTRFFISAYEPNIGTELWWGDGIITGVIPVENINPGSASSYPRYFLSHKGRLFFAATVSGYGEEPWVHDPEAGTTEMLKDIYSGNLGSVPTYFCGAGDLVYFSANSPEYGRELWRSDGTPEGTTLVADIDTSPTSSSPFNFLWHEGRLYMSAFTSEFGRELWKTDGTDEGTTIVKDIWPGVEGANPSRPVLYKGKMYFSARHAETGGELWETDGTEEGVRLVADINPGPSGSRPSQLTVFDDVLYFTATDGKRGFEWWRYDGSAPPEPVAHGWIMR
ncbi:MAG TPA: hypothetical protein PLB62_00510 [Candidatus Sumerlaeota bacterium]|nr:hypothetical protein [Candidatus Sumerlaeota bacterium]